MTRRKETWEDELRKQLRYQDPGECPIEVNGEYLDAARSLWAETEEDIAMALAWGEEKARLFAWLRPMLRRRLTLPERRAIELHYFHDLSYRQIGRRLKCNHSTVCRAVHRGVRKIRRAAELEGIALQWPPQKAPGKSTTDDA
jgi:RNA polymerase sigma factor (sigma-70 family)